MKIKPRFKLFHFTALFFSLLAPVALKPNPNNDQQPKKHVIASTNSGFFADFHGVLNHLLWCQKTGHTPAVYWGKESLYYQPGGYNGSENVWEYFFEPVSSISCSEHEPRNNRFSPGEERFFVEHYNHETRKLAKSIIDAHIKIKPQIQQKIDTFYQKNMSGQKIIGIHLRRTDKKHMDYDHLGITPVSLSVIFETANRQAELFGPDCQFLIVTDEYALLEEAQKNLTRPVVYYDCPRSTDGKALYFDARGVKQKVGALVGEGVLIEVQLLARCDLFIHTYYSNVSVAVLYFNPDLQNILLR